jgi:PAS domain S-box-containing protein
MAEGRDSGRNARLLIIDHDPRWLSATSRLLAQAGYETFQAANGSEGLRLARQTRPDLVFLNIDLPDMDGLEVCHRINTDPELVGTCVTILTGRDVDPDDKAEVLSQKALSQPVSDQELLLRVEAMLPGWRANMRQLRERVKELNCLYGISKLVQDTDLSLREILQGTLERMPPAWQYPEITCARITLAGQAYETPGFRETRWMQSCDIWVHAETAGALEVYYLEERPWEDEGPFLKEERNLLEAIGGQLSRVVERIQAEQALRASEERNVAERRSAEATMRRYQAMLDAVSDPISFVDRDYCYRFVNKAYSRYAKKPQSQICGLTIAELLGTEAFETLVKPHLDRCLDGQEVRYEAWFDVPKEKPRFMHVSYSPLFDENRAVTGAVVASRDLTGHRLAEDALQRERDLVARMMDTSPVGILVFDQEGRITFANPGVQELAGLLGISNLVGSSYNDPSWRLLDEHGDVLPDDRLPFARVLSTDQLVSDILYAIDLPGDQRAYLSSSAAPLRDHSGAFEGVIVTTQDVTSRIQAEARLQASEKQYRQLLEALQEGIWMIDADARTTFVNPRMAEMLGYTVEEMVGRHLFSFMDEQGIALAERNLERRRQGIHEQHDFEFLRKDGSRLYASLEASPILDEEGNYAGSLAGVQDTSDRVKTMVRLRESEERYRDLVEEISDVIYALDREGVITYVSPAIERLLGFAPEQIIGQPFGQFVLPEDLDQVATNFEELVSGRQRGPTEYRVIAASGELRWVSLSSQVILDGNQVTGVRGVLTDISERVWAQDQREKAAAAAERERLARDLHDAVTQSLFSVSAIAEALPTIWERDQAKARLGLEELRQLTQGVLAEMRTLLLELRPSALTEQKLDVLVPQLTEAMTGRTRMPITTRVTGDCNLPAEARIALYRIAQEALNNIVKHARASRATVELHCDARYARLRISDDGRGFDPLRVAHGHLGLEIMRERAQAIGASLRIESQPSQGTNVLVEWYGNLEGEHDG